MPYHPITKAIRTQTPTTDEMEHSTPLFLTSSFRFDSAEDMADAFNEVNDHNIYTRFSNPTVQEFTNKMCALEGAEDGFSCASGMAAIFGTFMTFLQSGDHILSCASIFGSTHTLLTKYMPKWGIDYSYGSVNDVDSWESLIKPNTKMIYLETPTNPGLDVVDMEAVGKLAKKHNLMFVVDNCFATPILQRPIEFGADLVIHSATKWLDGQGRVLGGIVVGKKELIREIYLFCRNTGPSMSPFNAWVLTKSLETLDVRIQRHCDNAEALAKKLEGHAKINTLKYPFMPSHPAYAIAKKQMSRGGCLVNFEVKGGLDAGRKFMNALKMITLTSNLGDSRSIASHPASTTHSKLSAADQLSVGITPGMIRLSVGLEHVDDIAADVLQALEQC
ncbi:O-succinylhomoserine sulfhydrylase [Filimonas lacunae]|uniref:O-succinylhomoserine sulfhydrylase n=1 Tax=Filimonas lacunae TaxID=477680 RepID=A0A173MMT8_9BACT|nr:aminotransferase class I/II-fold pyridoxal phosphate-dependent enzyme [Filimonas lacunae]BAV08779.1 O-acetylhomoserine sulfhydrylase [Filimonas lacunae]SIS61601.1 O-succinylhomoserine sulfhydrylase [Filimonas lacunae]